MAKKKQQLVVEVLSDKDWDDHIRFRDGLVVADIYSECFGPSAAILMLTKRYKVEHPEGELLTLAAVNADEVQLVKRLSGHSEPTFMFLVNGLMVNMYIGSNGPELVRLLDEEFTRELGVRQGVGRRRFLPFDKPTPAEIERNKRLDATAYAERRAEEERREAALRAIRERAYEQISQALKATTVVVFLTPSVEAGRLPELADELKDLWNRMGIDVVREDTVIINEEMANEMFYERKLPQHSLLVGSLQTGYSVAMMLKKVRPGEGEEDKGGQGDAPPPENDEEPVGDAYPITIGTIEKAVAETVYGFFPDGDDSEVEEELEEELVEEDSTEEEDDEEGWGQEKASSPKLSNVVLYRHQPKEMRPPPGSPAAQLIRRLSVERVNIPGIYAPFTPYSKSAAVRVLFPTIAEQYYELEELPPDPPPCVIVVFDAAKRDEVMEISTELTDLVVRMGFFNDKKERLADTVEEYNKSKRVGAKDKIVLSVVRTTSAPLLALSAAGPTYISPNKTIAKEDDKVYFGVDNIADPHRAETPPEPEEKEEHLPQTTARRAPVPLADGEEEEEDEEWDQENPISPGPPETATLTERGGGGPSSQDNNTTNVQLMR